MFTKIDQLLWKDQKFKNLSDDGKILFVYLITCPHRNMLGLYYLPIGYGSEDLDWDNKRFSKGLNELVEKGFINYNINTKIVFIRNFLKYNPIENPNQVKSALKVLDTIPANGVDSDIINYLVGLEKSYIEPLIEQLRKRLHKGLPKQEEVEVKEEEEVDVKKSGEKEKEKTGRFTPPSLIEIKEYCIERGNNIDPEQFKDFYESKNWMVGKNKMKDWKAAVRNWERRSKESGDQGNKHKTKNHLSESRTSKYSGDELEAMILRKQNR